jgi:hypothetical protein
MPKNPDEQPNTILFTTRERQRPDGETVKCIAQSPKTLQFTKKSQREIFLTANPVNDRDVVLRFDEARAKDLLASPPRSPLTLKPGHTVKLTIRERLGIQARADFGPGNDAGFVKSLDFEYDRCGQGDHNDIHVEC